MKQINGQKLDECFRYYRHLVTDDDIQEALDDLRQQEEENLAYQLAEKEEEIAELEQDIEQFERYKQFFEDVKDGYEDLHGPIYDTPPEKLAQWIYEELEKGANYKTDLINIREWLKERNYVCRYIPADIQNEI